MAGLLGDSWDDPRTMANFRMAAGLLGGGNFGQALGRGLEGYGSTMAAAAEAKRQAKSDAMVEEQLAWKRDDRTQAQASQVARQQALGKLQEALGAGQVTGQELLKLGIPMDLIKEAMQVKDMGRAEVARTIETEGPNGSKLLQQLDKFGNPVGQGVAGYTAPVQVNRGGSVDFVKPQPGVSLPITISPVDQQRLALSADSNNLARERFNFEKQGGASGVKTVFNAELGGFVTGPNAANPQGMFTPLPGISAAQPKLTEGEAKASLYLGQMKSAGQTIDELSANGVKSSPEAVRMANSFVGNYLAPAGAQQVAQAQNQWSEAYLRAKTGAAATPGEVQLNNSTFFPQPGDSKEVRQQKEQARAQAELDMTLPAGKGASRIAIAPKKDAASTSKAPMVGQVVDGWKYKGGPASDPNSWEKQ